MPPDSVGSIYQLKITLRAIEPPIWRRIQVPASVASGRAVSPSLASERAVVQAPLVRYATEIGWAYLSPEQALTLRRGESGTLLDPTLREKLIALNPGVVTVETVDAVIARIEGVRNTIEGNAEVLAWLRGERSVYVAAEKRQRNVSVIDFAHPAHNLFQVTDEWQYTNGQHTNRADVMFLVNGIPVALVETKGAAKRDGVDEGVTQIRRYHRERLPPEYSAVVYTSAHNDSAMLAEYRLNEDDEKRIRKAFIRPGTLPKILIVTEKLLTGFDAPILYCLYLDKPMRDHTLLQAIARVNRPYEEEGEFKKPAGFVLDFVGIFERLEKALAFDSDIVGSVIQNLDVLKQRFAALMAERAPAYLELCREPVDDKAVERALDAFGDKDKREAFYRFFQELEVLYEIISPDVFLREHLENYGRLSVLYEVVRNAFSKSVALYRDVARKTEWLVRERVASYGLTTTMPLVRIDEKTLDALKKSESSPNSKVFNLGKSLIQAATEEADRQPFLVPIGERAEAILEAFDDRQIGTQEALKQLERLLTEFVQAQRERERTGLDLNAFTIYWVLKQAGALEPDRLAPMLDAAIRRFPNHAHNVAELRQLKAELYKVLLPTVGKDRMVELAERLLRLQQK